MANIQLRVNQRGGIYDNGRNLPQMYRERVLDLAHIGMSQRMIASELRTSKHFIHKVLKNYDETNSAVPTPKETPRRHKITDIVSEYVEIEKICKPSIYTSELRERLVLDGIVHPADVPSCSAIKKSVRQDLLMSKKRIQCIPRESTTQDNMEYRNFFLEEVSNLAPTTLHFFDESSVVKTSMNRKYGNSRIGEPAFEIQRYASNRTFTINLLHSLQGIDYVNILDGASNGHELLLFFEEALNITKPDGSVAIEHGDTIILDNCGFHHGQFTETALRNMLGECGINVLFQPPYSPYFNTCEFCFRHIKAFLNKNQGLAEHQTEYCIFLSCESITQNTSMNIFRHCGYLI